MIVNFIGKYLKPNHKHSEAEIAKQINDVIIRNDINHNKGLPAHHCNYVDAYAKLSKKKPQSKFSKYGSEYEILNVLPDVSKKLEKDQ